MSQVGVFNLVPAGMDGAKLFVLDTDSLATNGVASSVVAGSNNATLYTVTWSSAVPVGRYDLIFYNGSLPLAGLVVDVSASAVTVVDDNASVISLLSAGSVRWTMPVLPSGKMAGPIVIGVDYVSNNLTSFKWSSTARSYSIASASCKLTLKKSNRAVCNCEKTVFGSVTLVSSNWQLEFDLLGTDTVDLEPGTYDWFAILVDDLGNESVVKFGTVELVCGPV